MIDIRSKIKQFLLPQLCLLCGGTAGELALCPSCRADLPWHTAPACRVCASPTTNGEVCGTCLRHPPAFDATLSLLDYRYPVDAMLRRYKYAGLLATAELMGSLLAERVAHAALPGLIIPMPLHPTRLKQRGFNQAAEIARIASLRLNIPLGLHHCSRSRATPPQAGLTLQERRKNLRGAFDCSAPLAGKHVALLDDVMTTGASLDALARTVRNAGAARVDCWVVARTPPH